MTIPEILFYPLYVLSVTRYRLSENTLFVAL